GNHTIRRQSMSILSVLGVGNQQVFHFIKRLIQNDDELFIKVDAVASLSNILQGYMYFSTATFLSQYIL
ncbi:MAG: hypothetical protein WA959_20585, partial [Rivularia sp. (in: cyanobacteria)]